MADVVNGDEEAGAAGDARDSSTKVDHETLKQLEEMARRSLEERRPKVVVASAEAQMREAFGAVAMAMMMLDRYRHLTIDELQDIIVEPLLRKRLVIAHSLDDQGGATDEIVGVAIWASVSDAVDASIREQVGAGTFPVRMKPDNWTSGDIKWLLDILAPTAEASALVLSNFRKIVPVGPLNIHPIVTRQLGAAAIEKLRAEFAK